MDDRVDLVLADDGADEVLVAAVADDECACAGTAQRKPVDRLSSTTTCSPASSSSSTMWLPM